MKTYINSLVILTALAFTACKKDNLQPTATPSTNIEQLNNQPSDDDKDIRNRYVGKWRRNPDMFTISKTGVKDLKVNYSATMSSAPVSSIYKNNYGKYVNFSNGTFVFAGETQARPCFIKKQILEKTHTTASGYGYNTIYITETTLTLYVNYEATDGSGRKQGSAKAYYPY